MVRAKTEIMRPLGGPDVPGETTMDKLVAVLGRGRAESALDILLEPSGAVTDAMARERKAGERRNGHGNHSYRDIWRAGISAILAGENS